MKVFFSCLLTVAALLAALGWYATYQERELWRRHEVMIGAALSRSANEDGSLDFNKLESHSELDWKMKGQEIMVRTPDDQYYLLSNPETTTSEWKLQPISSAKWH